MADFKTFRKLNKLTQQQAAEYFGCLQSFISQIETGRSIVPDSFISKILSDGIYQLPANMSKGGNKSTDSSLKSKAPTSKAAKRKMLEGIIFNPNRLITGAVAPACVPRVKESTESDANLKVIKAQEKTIATQERLISVLQAEVERLQRALEEKNND